jgi:hypothetical protein
MFPTQQGWITVDRPLATAARAITSHLQSFIPDEDSVEGNPSAKPTLNVESAERILVPISEIDSIEILSFLPLIQAIKKDFPKWDGLSEGLSFLFREQRIDPRIKYNQFYSAKRADIAAIYPWSGRSLFSLAGKFYRTILARCAGLFNLWE